MKMKMNDADKGCSYAVKIPTNMKMVEWDKMLSCPNGVPMEMYIEYIKGCMNEAFANR